MWCPKCRKKSLESRTVGSSGVRVEVCTDCRGIWFDKGELEAAVSVAAKDLRLTGDTTGTGLVCPACRKLLYSMCYPQTYVRVDMCNSCGGLWLDVKELREIRAVRGGLARRGRLDEYAPVAGVKGAFISFINSTIDTLGDFS